MERLQINLHYKSCNTLIDLIHQHNLPINATVAKGNESLRIVSLRFDCDDELLVEWLINKVDNSY